jgi:hypothetical protein
MSAGDIACALGDARREGREWRCRCPLHGGRSLFLRDGEDDRLLVNCFGGCDGRAVIVELHRLGLLTGHDARRHDDDHRRRDNRRDFNHERDVLRIAQARQIWDETRPAQDSPVAVYLASRHITIPPPPSLRFAPRCWHQYARAHLPAMVAVVEDVRGGIVGVHRTYLRSDGSGKADLPKEQQKLSLGPIGGGAVHFGMPQPGERFAVGEGIETTLAVVTACRIPGWAALSEGGVRNLILPPEATDVVICCDHDANGVGQRAADKAARRFLREGRRVRIAVPPEPDTDFADMLAGLG